MFDTNAIRHLIYNIQDRYDQKVKRLWTERQFEQYEKFIHFHKGCGLYVRLVVVNAEQEDSHAESPETENVFIQGSTGEEYVKASPQLKLIRGRR